MMSGTRKLADRGIRVGGAVGECSKKKKGMGGVGGNEWGILESTRENTDPAFAGHYIDIHRS